MAQTNVTTNPATTSNIMKDIGTELPKNVGHLLKEPVEIVCPACRQRNVTRVEQELATCLQKVMNALYCLCCCCLCPKLTYWEGRVDYNHYCSECGCFIGRYLKPNLYKRYMMLNERETAVSGGCCRYEPKEKVAEEAKPIVPEPVASNTPYAPTTMPMRK